MLDMPGKHILACHPTEPGSLTEDPDKSLQSSTMIPKILLKIPISGL